MKVGFTGSRYGMTDEQKEALKTTITNLKITEFHHGDCVGADEEAHNLVREITDEIHVHPPNKNNQRAFCKGDHNYFEQPYLRRNKEIVDRTEVLIATPNSDMMQKRGGTWYTVRYALRKKKTVVVILPNGRIVDEDHMRRL